LALAAAIGTAIGTSPSSPTPTTARIALANGVHDGKVSATGAWLLLANGGTKTLVRGTGRGAWTITQRSGGKLGVTNERGEAATRPGPLVARAADDGVFVTWNGKRYRGELEIRATSEGLLVINRLPVEDYLRGVIPLELGDITDGELAAMEAQAVAARSYTYVRLADPDLRRRAYDLVATTTDQVYGGASAESRLGDQAVQQTTGEVIRYNGRVVNAPYFAACGGMTAAASEIWREGDLPYLRPVSDLIPGSGGQYYCQGSSKFRWSRTFSGSQLQSLLEKYLHRHAGALGAVKTVIADGPTPSGRVASLTLVTDRNYYKFRGNEIRSVLRAPNGEILNSTYFELDVDGGVNGHVESLTLRGLGNGHGVGMCQAGAIGRARAGQDYRTILETYYPGTVIATVD
jgi:stage II sporulation protein D